MSGEPHIRPRRSEMSSGVIRILHQDGQIIVIDKPPGMLSHRHAMDRHSPNIQAVLERELGRPIYLVHRLDRMTSGLMVIGLTRESAASLSLQFRDRSTTKRYVAIVRGHTDDTGRVTTSLEGASGIAAEADTSFVTLGRGIVHEQVGRYPQAWFSLIEIQLHTGRRHQARRHMHQINHPVLGDNRHGDKEHNRWASARFGERHLYLRSRELEFEHPVDRNRISAVTGVPELWLGVLNHMGIAVPKSLTTATEVRVLA